MTTIDNKMHPSFGEAFMVWLKIGCINFGGPAGQIALMHRVTVDEKKWVDEARFLHALNFCMLLPGPEAQKLATYLGWLLHGVRGGLAAGVVAAVGVDRLSKPKAPSPSSSTFKTRRGFSRKICMKFVSPA